MEAKDMHRNIPGATAAPPPPAPPPPEPALASPPEPPLPEPDVPPWPAPAEAPSEVAPVDSPKAQEIKAELAHLDEIEATLPARDDTGEPDDVDDDGEAGRHDGTPHRKKRRHR